MKKLSLQWIAFALISAWSLSSFASIEAKEARPFFRFHLEPQVAVVGVPLTFFAQLETEISSQEPVARGYIDGTENPIELIQSADKLWVARLGSFTEVKSQSPMEAFLILLRMLGMIMTDL